MRHFFLCLALALATLLPALPAAAQHKNKDTKTNASAPVTQRKTIVDDEDCGCELVFIDGIQTTQRNGLFGFKLEDGTEIVPPRYKFVDEFHNGFCIVLADYDQYGLINRRGEEVLPCIFKEIAYPSEGIIRARKDQLYGYYDTTGREIIAPQWRSAGGFVSGMAVVGVQTDSNITEYGYIDTHGRWVLSPRYEYAYPFVEGRAVVQQYERFGLIDSTGKEIIPIKYLVMSSPNEGRVFARDPQTMLIAMFDLDGRRITDFRYDDILSFGDGLYAVLRNGNQYYLNANGKERYGTWELAGRFIEGFATVKRNGKYGILNRKGKLILPCEYDYSNRAPEEYVFHDGLALVEKDGKFGFVDTKGTLVIPIEYPAAFYFSEGLAPVRKGNFWGFIDRHNHEVIPFMFGPCSAFEYGRASVLYNNKEYKINPGGQCVKACGDFPTALVQRRMAELAVQRRGAH